MRASSPTTHSSATTAVRRAQLPAGSTFTAAAVPRTYTTTNDAVVASISGFAPTPRGIIGYGMIGAADLPVALDLLDRASGS
ncbi:hypothetical protein [Dactylosporangium sp. NPDC005555]|uniref:hypothetical protein n=1 Tax=Dactylosporangium sp. NPDC005555 TaxID=3154889 RepID=UPI0033B90BF9